MRTAVRALVHLVTLLALSGVLVMAAEPVRDVTFPAPELAPADPVWTLEDDAQHPTCLPMSVWPTDLIPDRYVVKRYTGPSWEMTNSRRTVNRIDRSWSEDKVARAIYVVGAC